MTSCIFCQIVEGALHSSRVYEDEICFAFMDIQPVNPGHVLVIPKAHFVDLTDLPADLGTHLFQVAQRIILSLPKTDIKIEGANLFLAHGEAAGAEDAQTRILYDLGESRWVVQRNRQST